MREVLPQRLQDGPLVAVATNGPFDAYVNPTEPRAVDVTRRDVREPRKPTGQVTPDQVTPDQVTHRLIEVDGLRAVAVCAVMAFHFDLPLPGGFLGVDLFLAISGFVIARGLLRSAESSVPTSVVLKRFVTRRASRLLPAAIVAVCCSLVLVFLGQPSFGNARRTVAHAFAAFGGVANWFVVAFPDEPGESARVLLHTWSLGLEEQCYLVLPLLLLAQRSRARIVALVVGAFCVAIALAACRLWPSPDVSFFSTLSRLAPIGTGVGLAALLHGGSLSARRSTTPMFVVLALCLLPALLRVHWRDPMLYSGGFVLVSFVCAGLVGCAAFGGSGIVHRVLRSAPLQLVGARSYALYLVHFPVAFLFSSFGFAPRTVLRIVVSVLLAEVLHRVVEYRFLPAVGEPRSAWRFAPLGMAVAGVAGFALARGGQ
jgi:peptidoglycan/LPS O-acetylase OafA/YrhL